MKVFSSISHFFAWFGSLFVTAESDLTAIEAQVSAAVASPLAQAIAKLDPALASKAVNVMLAIGGTGVNLLVNAGAAVAAGGLNLTLDSAVIASLEEVIPAIKAALAGQTVPVAQTMATPIVAAANSGSSTASVLN